MEEPSVVGGALVVVSPHLDDAVFGAGDLVAAQPGAVIVTVFAGSAPRTAQLTEWDRLAGFGEGDDVVAARRAEDAAACMVLDATPRWLGFLDAQYGEVANGDEIRDALVAVLSAAQTAVVPLGLFHSDHVAASDAAFEACRRCPWLATYSYVDGLYGSMAGLVDERLELLHTRGIALEACRLDVALDVSAKRRAVRCYASQLRALRTPGHVALSTLCQPGRFFSVSLR